VILSSCVHLIPAEQLSESVYVKTALHCAFSFTVGWLNCIMLLRYRVFATMMVGNTILMGVAVVCNGGLGVAEDTMQWDEYWFSRKHARVLCPAQFESASYYMIMICLFLLGAFVHGLLFKKCQWSSRAFAPIIAAGIISVEILEYADLITDSKMDVYLLSPIFGMFVSISAHCGVGSVPWAATGHMTSMSFKLASFCSDWNPADLQKAVVNLCLWLSFLMGIVMGTLFHSNKTVMLNALYLHAVLVLNGMIYTDPDRAKDALLPRPASGDVNGIDDRAEAEPIATDVDVKQPNYSST